MRSPRQRVYLNGAMLVRPMILHSLDILRLSFIPILPSKVLGRPPQLRQNQIRRYHELLDPRASKRKHLGDVFTIRRCPL